MDRRYYSERGGSSVFDASNLKRLKILFKSIYADFDGKGYFQTAFGKECPDAGYIRGSEKMTMEDHLTLRFPARDFLRPDEEAIDRLLSADIVDLIEYLHDHAARPTDSYFHRWDGCGLHVRDSSVVAGRQDWVKEWDAGLSRLNPRLILTESGEVVPRDKMPLKPTQVAAVAQQSAHSVSQPGIGQDVDSTLLTNSSDSARDTLASKVAKGEFDVFLAYNSIDKPFVEGVAKALKARGVFPWIDKEQVPPGRWFQDVIQQAIPRVKSVAVFVGTNGIGRWQAVELKTFVSQCVERGIPVIPILLPGVASLPAELPFLRELNYIQFAAPDDAESLKALVWGITGENPHFP